VKIAVIHNLRRGGAHRRLGEHVRHLGTDVVEVTLATAAPVTDDPVVVDYEPAAPGTPRPFRPPLRYRDLAGLRRAWEEVAAAVGQVRPEVVYANPCRFLQAPPALLALRLPAVYFCDEPRRVDYEREAAESRSARTRLLYRPLYAAERRLDRAAVAASDRVVTNSRYTAAAIERCYGRAADVLPLGVSDAFRASPRLPRHLLSVGSLIPDKGHELVLRAAALTTPRWPVVVVTPRDDPVERTRLERCAAALDVPLAVRIGISDEDLAHAYREAFATLYLARAEPLGLVSLEAQACGSPVVVAAEGGLPETVVEGETGFVVAREPGAVADRLEALADGGMRARIAHAAGQWGASHSWSRSAAALRLLLEAACEEGNPQPDRAHAVSRTRSRA
jgi:glycosyltransferase involved in cell wall biosynthesis